MPEQRPGWLHRHLLKNEPAEEPPDPEPAPEPDEEPHEPWARGERIARWAGWEGRDGS